MTMRILSLWLPRLPTDRLAVRAGGRAVEPSAPGATVASKATATILKIKGAQRVVAVSAAAEAGAVRPGMTLADARAVLPALAVHPADLAGEAATLGRLADWCGRFTPLVALDGGDGLLLDIGGAAHLFGGEAALLAEAERGLAGFGFTVRGGLAATPEAAWALARFGRGGIAPADDQAFRKLFGAMPLGALRLPADTVGGLAQAGLRHIDDLLWRPRAPLAARFGDRLWTRLDAVLGTLKFPISPRFDPPAFVAEQRFASPIVLVDDIERTLLALSEQLCALLERHGQGARRIEARLFRVDGAVKRMAVGTSRPLARAPEMARLFREKIEGLGEEGLDTGYGFDVVRLSAQRADPLPARQAALPQEQQVEAGRAEDLADLLDRLGARLGLARVTRLVGQDTHIPEFAVRAVPVARSPAARPAPGKAASSSIVKAPAEPPTRPIRLFERPEPIEAIAGVPDGPPKRFRWRRAVHELAAVEGPERIAPEWWNAEGPALTRDYFQAEDQHGHRFWLFREGLFTELQARAGVSEELIAEELPLAEGSPLVEKPAPQPQWFVHGLFG